MPSHQSPMWNGEHCRSGRLTSFGFCCCISVAIPQQKTAGSRWHKSLLVRETQQIFGKFGFQIEQFFPPEKRKSPLPGVEQLSPCRSMLLCTEGCAGPEQTAPPAASGVTQLLQQWLITEPSDYFSQNSESLGLLKLQAFANQALFVGDG